MALTNLTLYYNTAFNIQNTPANESVLNANSQQTQVTIYPTNDVYEATRVFKFDSQPSAMVSGTKIVKSSDSGLFYDVVDVHWNNSTVVTMRVRVNPVLSFPNATVSGQIDRITPTANEINMLPEPYQPRDPLVVNFINSDFPKISTDIPELNICSSNVMLKNVRLWASYYTNRLTHTTYEYDDEGKLVGEKQGWSEGSPGQYFGVPVSQINDEPYLGLYLYDTDKTETTTALTWANRANMAGCIVGRWSVPSPYARATYRNNTGSDGSGDLGSGIAKLSGNSSIITVSNAIKPLEMNYGILNPKAYYYSYNYILTAKKSSESKTYRLVDVCQTPTDATNLGQVAFMWSSDPSEHGKPYAYPRWYKGHQGMIAECSVGGSRWDNPGMRFDGKAGQLQGDYETSHALRNMHTNQEENKLMSTVNVIGGVGSTVVSGITGDLGGAVKGAASTFGTAMGASYNEQRNAENMGYARYTNLISKTLYTPTYIGASLEGCFIYDNTFMLRAEHYTVADMQRFDKFLQMYGYSENYAVSDYNVASTASRGSQFGFIKMGDCAVSINTPVVGAEAAYTQLLQGGLRIWNTGVTSVLANRPK